MASGGATALRPRRLVAARRVPVRQCAREAMDSDTFERLMQVAIPVLILVIPVLGGLVLLVVGLVRRRQAAELAVLARREASYRAWQDAIERLSLPCESCGQPAHPVPASVDRYVCPACHHSFSGERHDAPLPPPES